MLYGLAVAIGTAAAAFIRAAIVAPHRVTQVQVAGVRGRADHTTGNGTSSGTHGGIAREGTDGGTAGGANHGATGHAVTGSGTAACDQQGRCKSDNHSRAHVLLSACVVLKKRRTVRNGSVPVPQAYLRLKIRQSLLSVIC
jgi:hypothetical protein